MATLIASEYEATGCFCSFGGGELKRKIAPKRRNNTTTTTTIQENDDAALAKEMNELSVTERERMFEEIHGVADEIEETPEFTASCMEALDVCISKLSQSKRRDLDRALFLKPSILKDLKFKLMFLRAENYNAQKSAERMARYFTLKRDLFGEDKLVQKITLEDMDEKDIEVARDGGVALPLAKYDRAGRPVLFVDATRSNFHNNKSVIRSSFHHLMGMIEDEAAQKKGVVMLMFCPGREFVSGRPPTPSEVLTFFKESSVLRRDLPFRVTSFHYCYDNPLTKFFINVIQAAMGKDVRLRLRSHYGSATEIRYSLRSFGILTEGIILSEEEEDGTFRLGPQCIERRRVAEEQNRQLQENDAMTNNNNSGLVEYPTHKDVLLGRGRPYQEFPGNQQFVKLVDPRVERYKACAHVFEKTKVLMDAMKDVHLSGGRFLKRTPDGWEVAGEQVTLEKIRKTFQTRPNSGGARATANSAPKAGRSAKRLKVDRSVAMVGG